MSKIHQKLGLKAPGKRAMMKLPTNRTTAANLTAAQCPACGARGVIENTVKGTAARMCTWCLQSWPVTP
jgi:transcription elongation factor Elf1